MSGIIIVLGGIGFCMSALALFDAVEDAIKRGDWKDALIGLLPIVVISILFFRAIL